MRGEERTLTRRTRTRHTHRIDTAQERFSGRLVLRSTARLAETRSCLPEEGGVGAYARDGKARTSNLHRCLPRTTPHTLRTRLRLRVHRDDHPSYPPRPSPSPRQRRHVDREVSRISNRRWKGISREGCKAQNRTKGRGRGRCAKERNLKKLRTSNTRTRNISSHTDKFKEPEQPGGRGRILEWVPSCK